MLHYCTRTRLRKKPLEMLLLRTGDLEGAKTQLEKYLEVAPDGPDAATASETVKYL